MNDLFRNGKRRVGIFEDLSALEPSEKPQGRNRDVDAKSERLVESRRIVEAGSSGHWQTRIARRGRMH